MNTRSSATCAAYLLEEILFHNIFPRLAVKTLIRFKSACKAWNRIISDPHFVKLHFIQQKNSSHMFLFRITFSHDTHFCSLALGQSDAAQVGVNLEFRRFSPMFVGSYNGLVCMALRNSGCKLILWNPSTTETKIIPTPNPSLHYNDLVGFTYDSTLDDYKLIRIYHTPDKKTCAFDVYSLKTNSWKFLKEAPPEFVTFTPFRTHLGCGFELNGFMYWHVYFGNDSLIVGLCLVDLSFNEITFPQDMLEFSPTSSGVQDFKPLGTCLAAFTRVENKLLMWAMKDPEKKERKWEKIITLSSRLPEFLGDTIIKPIWFTMDGKVLLFIAQATQQKFALYDPQTGSVEFNQIYGFPQMDKFFYITPMTYIETLVSPNMFKSKTRRVTSRRKCERCGHNGR